MSWPLLVLTAWAGGTLALSLMFAFAMRLSRDFFAQLFQDRKHAPLWMLGVLVFWLPVLVKRLLDPVEGPGLLQVVPESRHKLVIPDLRAAVRAALDHQLEGQPKEKRTEFLLADPQWLSCRLAFDFLGEQRGEAVLQHVQEWQQEKASGAESQDYYVLGEKH